jgi:competence protein ComGE
MHQERKGLLLEQQARFFLANELDRVRVDEQGYLEKKMTWQGVEVRLLYKDEQPHSSICVGYSDYRSNEKQRCMYAFLE